MRSVSGSGCSQPETTAKRSAHPQQPREALACPELRPDHPLLPNQPPMGLIGSFFMETGQDGWSPIVIIRRPGLSPEEPAIAVQADAEKVTGRCSRPRSPTKSCHPTSAGAPALPATASGACADRPQIDEPADQGPGFLSGRQPPPAAPRLVGTRPRRSPPPTGQGQKKPPEKSQR